MSPPGIDLRTLPRRPGLTRLPLLLLLVANVVGQRDAAARGKVDKPSKPAGRASSRTGERPTSNTEPPPALHTRGDVFAIGDLHGDLAAARRAFRCAKVIDENDRWIGGHSVVVQTGDVLDRGNEERPLLEWLDGVARQAKAAGGALYRIQGNHEVMNVALDFRYVAEAGLSAFADASRSPSLSRERDLPAPQRGRASAFRPGGPWSDRLAAHPVVLQVNDSVFVHGGLLPQHLRYGLARLNAELSAWMRGSGGLTPMLSGDDAPYWDRTYGQAVTPADCRVLDDILARLSAKRLVVGHTPQKGGISFACSGRLARIDVGLSSAHGRHPAQVLEISGGSMKILTEAISTR